MLIHSKWMINSHAYDEINSEIRSATKLECWDPSSEIKVCTKATTSTTASTKAALEYLIVRDYSNHLFMMIRSYDAN